MDSPYTESLCSIYWLVYIKGELKTRLNPPPYKRPHWSGFTGRSQQVNSLQRKPHNLKPPALAQAEALMLTCYKWHGQQINLPLRTACVTMLPGGRLSYLANTTAQILNKRCQGYKGVWCKPYGYFCLTLSSKAAPGRHSAKQKAKRTEETSLIYCL